jgi:hypothetical protein
MSPLKGKAAGDRRQGRISRPNNFIDTEISFFYTSYNKMLVQISYFYRHVLPVSKNAGV